MEHMTEAGIENMLRTALFRNDTHKRALYERLFDDTAICDEELMLVAGGGVEEKVTIDEAFKPINEKGGIQ